jgi:hypothetical protein
MPYDAYIEGSEPSEAPSSLPTGDIQAEIAQLQADPSLMDPHDFRRGAILDRLEELYRQLGDGQAQDEPQEEEQPTDEPLEVKPVGDAVEEALDQLEAIWGEELTANIQIAQAAVADLSQSLGGNVGAFLESANLANDPVVIKVFHALGSGAPEPKLSKAEAQRLLTRLQNTTDYFRSFPLHDAVVDVVADLMAMIHP